MRGESLLRMILSKWEEKEMGVHKQENQYPSHESKQRTLSEFMS